MLGDGRHGGHGHETLLHTRNAEGRNFDFPICGLPRFSSTTVQETPQQGEISSLILPELRLRRGFTLDGLHTSNWDSVTPSVECFSMDKNKSCFFLFFAVVLGLHVRVQAYCWLLVFLKYIFTDALNFEKAPRSHRGAEGTWRWLRLLVVLFLRRTSDAVPWSLYSDSPLSSRPQPRESGGDTTPCEDTRGDHELSFNFSHQVLLQCVVFKCRCEKCNKHQL